MQIVNPELTMTIATFILLLIFQLKHFLADYPLQTKSMLGKFNQNGWVKPLSKHCAVHAFFTAFIVAVFTANIMLVVTLALFDFVVHFCMDRIKASPNIGGRWKPTEKLFWIFVGTDQMVHHLTHYAIIACIVFSII